jgi:hypothetical protein
MCTSWKVRLGILKIKITVYFLYKLVITMLERKKGLALLQVRKKENKVKKGA